MVAMMGLAVCAGAQPIKTEEKPATPTRIVVGGRAQAAYWGPAPQWFNSGGAALSDKQIADLEGVLSRDPDDLCSRGYLIAHGRQGAPRRMDHVVWMIDHHSEWDGFLLNLSRSGYGELDGGGADRVRDAWLKQIGAEQRSGMVLHHAAVFFVGHEPARAEGLLERAIHMEPKEGIHAERLGGLWGRYSIREKASPVLSDHARRMLLASLQWPVVAGALYAIHPNPKAGRGGDWAEALGARLRELGWKGGTEMPSRSARHGQYRCAVVQLSR